MKKLIWIVIVVLIILLIMSVVKDKVEPGMGNSEVVKIGVVSSLTGNAAYYGQSTMKGAEIGKIVAEVIYPDLQIQLFHEDSLFTPKGGIDAYNKLRNAEKIDALISQASNIGVALQPLALKDGILQISTSVLANNYSTLNDLSFRLTAKGDHEVKPAVDYMVSKGYKKLAIININNEIGVSLSDSLKREISSRGIELVAHETFAPDVTDFRTNLAKIKQSVPDVLYLASLASHTSQIMRQANELSMSLPLVSFRAAEDPVLIKNVPELAHNIVYTNAFDSESLNKETKDFIEAWSKIYNEEPNGYAAEAYEAVLLIAKAFSECGKDYECIQNNLSEIKNHPSVFGSISFDEYGDITYPFFLKTVKDGKFVKLKN